MTRKWNFPQTLLTTFLLTCCLAAPGLAQRDAIQYDYKTTVLRTQIILEGVPGSAPAQPITMYIYDGMGYLLRTVMVQSGEWVAVRLPRGVFGITYRGEKWLGRRVAVDTSSRRREQTVVLLAGDANGDNQVDWADMDILADAYQSDYNSPNWDSRADFDCDGDVDDADADLLFNNLYLRGD